ncbi:hypothetical protein F2Q70_00044052 [Brassica cretica]|uniref:Uncharacterized protein n=1 Tax=Brassica cretica TaxID=69181 RepID=A0A8S9KG28_BRACR|nr:hypothetical protein F2Q70_00044052 [Brassica cretica]
MHRGRTTSAAKKSKPPLISLIWLRPPFGRAIVRPPPLPRSCVSPVQCCELVLEDGACLIVPVSSSCLEFMSARRLVGVPTWSFCAPALFSTGVLWWVAWGLRRMGLVLSSW